MVEASGLSVDPITAVWVILGLAVFVGCVIAFSRWRYNRLCRADYKSSAALYSLAERLFVAASQEDALGEGAETARKVAGGSHCFVLMARPGNRKLEYVVGSNPLPRTVVLVGTISGPATCFRSGETTEVPDAENCPFLNKEAVRKRRQKALLYVPIKAGGQTIGVLEIEDRKRKRGFSREQIARAEHAAKITALGLRIAEQREMKEQLHRSEKLAAVSELAGAMAQDLGDPFNKIRGLIDGAEWERSPRKVSDCLDAVAVEVDHAISALERLMRFASPSAGAPQEVDINALLRELVADLRQRRESSEFQIRLGLSKRAVLVMADPTHIEQVFLILLRHAEHFLEQIQGRSLQIHSTRREGFAVVSISPTSRRDRSLRSNIARAGTDQDPSGSFGLSICQSLIERVGGSLEIDRSSSLGFQIEVLYPLSEESWQDNEPLSEPTDIVPLRSGPLTALIIDPDRTVQEQLVYHLAELSYRAIPVSTAEEALELFERVEFDWVFCELRLRPYSGVEIYERLRSRVEQFVFLADKASEAEHREVFRGEGRAVLRKPFTSEDVEGLVDSLLRNSVSSMH